MNLYRLTWTKSSLTVRWNLGLNTSNVNLENSVPFILQDGKKLATEFVLGPDTVFTWSLVHFPSVSGYFSNSRAICSSGNAKIKEGSRKAAGGH